MLALFVFVFTYLSHFDVRSNALKSRWKDLIVNVKSVTPAYMAMTDADILNTRLHGYTDWTLHTDYYVTVTLVD